MRPLAEVIADIDRLHADDPKGLELSYAENMTRWLEKLEPSPDPLLTIAVRAQHLRRWECPRAQYPAGRKGYLQWRRHAAEHHARLVSEVLRRGQYDAEQIDRVSELVLKRGLGTDRDAQTLEDCACLVFLETALPAFTERHPKPKVDQVLRKTWNKMSPTAQRLAGTFLTADRIANDATSNPSDHKS